MLTCNLRKSNLQSYPKSNQQIYTPKKNKKCTSVSGCSKQKEHNSLSIIPKPANCTFITIGREINLI